LTRIRLLGPVTQGGETIPAGREIDADPDLARGLISAGRGLPAPEAGAPSENRQIAPDGLNRRGKTGRPGSLSAPDSEASAE
jgi:hypothetical protein